MVRGGRVVTDAPGQDPDIVSAVWTAPGPIDVSRRTGSLIILQ
jgi:hypothetical protein